MPYGAAKGGIDVLTIGLGKEVAGEGIRVTGLRPGLIDTEMQEETGIENRIARFGPTVPLGRAGSADEVAEAALWLLSDRASYVTGDPVQRLRRPLREMTMDEYLSEAATLPADGCAGVLVGRVWLPGDPGGPGRGGGPGGRRLRPHAARADDERAVQPAAIRRRWPGRPNAPRIGALAPDPGQQPLGPPRSRPCPGCWPRSTCRRSRPRASPSPAPCSSAWSRSSARAIPTRAPELRQRIEAVVGADLRAVRPGSEAAARLKEHLVAQGAWSQYLEVGIGADAEIFTKSQPMSAVGHGAEVGVLPSSRWNNPEPELVLVVSAAGRIVGATLGNDVNLRDVEGRSALLLGKAKDNNASCSLGPFVRLVDAGFGLDAMRAAEIELRVAGRGRLSRSTATSSMREISRDIEDLVGAGDRPAPRLPGRVRAVLRHDVRAGRRPRRAGAGLHPPPRRHRHDRLADARPAGQPGRALHADRAVAVRHRRADAQPARARPALSDLPDETTTRPARGRVVGGLGGARDRALQVGGMAETLDLLLDPQLFSLHAHERHLIRHRPVQLPRR